MRRLFWLGLGIGFGATGALAASRWVQRQAERLAPPTIARRASRALAGAGGDAGETLAAAAGEFRKGMAEREAELRAAGLVRDTAP
jgi:hypothetical protein